MKIRSKKTKLEHTVTAEGWEAIKGRGDAPKYIIVANDTKSEKQPEDTHKADYNRIVKDANRKMAKKDYDGAKKLYEQAAAINKTDLITEKLAEIQGFTE